MEWHGWVAEKPNETCLQKIKEDKGGKYGLCSSKKQEKTYHQNKDGLHAKLGP